jgi:hypothetical protein
LGLEVMDSCGANQPAIGVAEPRGMKQIFNSSRVGAASRHGKLASSLAVSF